jgi:hypothetical protein
MKTARALGDQRQKVEAGDEFGEGLSPGHL